MVFLKPFLGVADRLAGLELRDTLARLLGRGARLDEGHTQRVHVGLLRVELRQDGLELRLQSLADETRVVDQRSFPLDELCAAVSYHRPAIFM